MNATFFKWFQRLVLIVVPLALMVLEWNHPSGFSKNVYHGLSHMSHWWTMLHIIQSFLFGAVAVGAILLTFSSNGLFGSLSKFFIWLFAVSYLVFDSTAGIGVGFILGLSHSHPEINVDVIKSISQLLYSDPIIGGSSSFFSLLGSWSWLIGIAFAIVVIFLNNRIFPLWKLLIPLILLAVSAYSLYVGHYAPYGPIAFGALALSALWMDYFRFKL